MTIDFGIRSRLTAWSLLMTRSPSMFRPGSDLGRDPVATTRFLALMAWPEFFTTTLCSDSITPSPWNTVTLFFLSRNSVPRQSWLTTLSLRLITCGQSIWRPSVLMPSAAALLISCASSEEWRNDLVGMQPRCRQVPPTFSFSMTATLSPSWAPRIAPTYPAEPPPMTATSNASSGIRHDCTHPLAGCLSLQQRQRRPQLEVLGEVIRRLFNGVFVLGAGQGHRLVRRDPGLFNRVALGCQPVGDGEVQVAITEDEILLHRPFAEGLDSHQRAAPVVLDGAGRNLRGARRILVEQHHQLVGEGAARPGDVLLRFLAASLHQDGTRPAVDELADHVVGGVDVATRVVPQVEQHQVDRSLQVVLQRIVELGRGPVAELEDPDVEHAVVKDLGGDARHVDLLARQVEVQRLAVAVDQDLDLGVRFASTVIDGVMGGPPLGALAIDGGDDVPNVHPGLLRGGARQDARNDDLVRLLLHRGTDPGELSGEEGLVGAILLRRQVA